MSDFWHWWIIAIVLGSLSGCVWLIRWTQTPQEGETPVGAPTGHMYDGIEEFNNPLPRWWLGLFYITIVFALIYLALYPGLGHYEGMLGWTEIKQLQQEKQAAEDKFGPIFKEYAKQDIATLAKDEKALGIGKRLFLNNCSVCHGSAAMGAKGFPNLTDNDWLYGGEPKTIEKTILDGRRGQMPALAEAIGGPEAVAQVAAYVQSLSGMPHDAKLAVAGKEKFAVCTGCHNPAGTGNQIVGAPNLTDKIWLYGRSEATIKEAVEKGHLGVMPAHRGLLGEDKVHILAAYIYSLSQKK